MSKNPWKKDPYLKMAAKQFRDLDGAIAQASADMQQYQAMGDGASARSALQQLADLQAQKQNLANLQNQYVQSRQPPPEPTREERAARPWDKMDWRDALEIARNSKYGSTLDASDPYVRAGYEEVARRRQRGE